GGGGGRGVARGAGGGGRHPGRGRGQRGGVRHAPGGRRAGCGRTGARPGPDRPGAAGLRPRAGAAGGAVTRPAVLIVDDSLTVRMDLAEAFEHDGFEVTPCAGLQAARHLLEREAAALVVLGLLLGAGDGIELLGETGATPRHASLPTVLLSSEAEVRDRMRGLTTGADAYVAKPYEPADLIARAR